MTKAVYIGSDIPLHNYYTTVAFYNLTGTDWEYQHSAFTEQLKQDVLSHTSKTQYQSTTANSTDFSSQIKFTNGNIGYINTLYPNNFYIQSNLGSGNNIMMNSGIANIFLQTESVYLGKIDSSNQVKSNLLMLGSDGTTWERQSSAFTEIHKGLISTHSNQILDLQDDIITLTATQNAQVAQLAQLQLSDATQNTKITTLEGKTLNITANSL